MTRKEALVILGKHTQLTESLKYSSDTLKPTIEAQILVVEQILIGLGIAWTSLRMEHANLDPSGTASRQAIAH